MNAPLAGLGVLVTRPAHQAGPLGAALAAAGATPLPFPTLAIGPTPDPQAFERALDAVATAAAVIFVSANAVAAAAPRLAARGGPPPGVHVLAVGPASARALEEAGITPVETPSDRHDSEGLLALPALAPAAVAGGTVVLVRGGGGRVLLAAELRRRGARVVVAEGYTRRPGPVDPQQLATWLAEGVVHAVTVTSRACLVGLLDACPAGRMAELRALPLAVLAPVLARHAGTAGWTGPVLVAPRAADAALVEALVAWRRARGQQ